MTDKTFELKYSDALKIIKQIAEKGSTTVKYLCPEGNIIEKTLTEEDAVNIDMSIKRSLLCNLIDMKDPVDDGSQTCELVDMEETNWTENPYPDTVTEVKH